MGSYINHISQAQKNITFLKEVNSLPKPNWDWQVTISFYSAVHFVNAYLAEKGDLHYRTHEDVKNALNTHNPMALYRIPENIYVAYVKLEGLSRRARYLCHEDFTNRATTEFFTYDKHFAKAIKNLDVIVNYFSTLYKLNITDLEVKCVDLEKTPLVKFKVIKS